MHAYGPCRVRAAATDSWRRHVMIRLDGLRADAAHPLPGRPLDVAAVREAMRFG